MHEYVSAPASVSAPALVLAPQDPAAKAPLLAQAAARLQAAIEAAVREMIGAFGPQKYIANLGSGLMGWESPEKVAFLVDTIHKVSEETIAAEK